VKKIKKKDEKGLERKLRSHSHATSATRDSHFSLARLESSDKNDMDTGGLSRFKVQNQIDLQFIHTCAKHAKAMSILNSKNTHCIMSNHMKLQI